MHTESMLTFGMRYGPVAERPAAFTTWAPYSTYAPASHCRTCSSAVIVPSRRAPTLRRATTPWRWYVL